MEVSDNRSQYCSLNERVQQKALDIHFCRRHGAGIWIKNHQHPLPPTPLCSCVLGLTQDYKNSSQIISIVVNLDGSVFIDSICLFKFKTMDSDSITENLLEMQIPEPHPRPAKLESLGAGPDAQLSPTTGDSDAL